MGHRAIPQAIEPLANQEDEEMYPTRPADQGQAPTIPQRNPIEALPHRRRGPSSRSHEVHDPHPGRRQIRAIVPSFLDLRRIAMNRFYHAQ